MNKKVVIFLVVMCSGFLLFTSLRGFLFLRDGKLHVIFCNVGQGDGILIKSPQGKIVLLDGGPDDSFSRCLAEYLPFWHKTIDLMLVTHPHSDHFLGDMTILQTHSVKQFGTEDLTSDQKPYQLLLTLLQDKKVPSRVLQLGETVHVGELTFMVAGPSQDLLARSSPNGQIGESKEFASLLILLRFGNISFLLPGDSQAAEMHEAIEKFSIGPVSILQSPHHGSATGLDPELLATLKPQIGVISVGAHNRYGHPAASTLKLFQNQNVQVLRTDQEGDIELVTDGRTVSKVR